MFWLACEELKKETNKTVVEEKVRQIYEDFISILSPKEVSCTPADSRHSQPSHACSESGLNSDVKAQHRRVDSFLVIWVNEL